MIELMEDEPRKRFNLDDIMEQVKGRDMPKDYAEGMPEYRIPARYLIKELECMN